MRTLSQIKRKPRTQIACRGSRLSKDYKKDIFGISAVRFELSSSQKVGSDSNCHNRTVSRSWLLAKEEGRSELCSGVAKDSNFNTMYPLWKLGGVLWVRGCKANVQACIINSISVYCSEITPNQEVQVSYHPTIFQPQNLENAFHLYRRDQRLLPAC